MASIAGELKDSQSHSYTISTGKLDFYMDGHHRSVKKKAITRLSKLLFHKFANCKNVCYWLIFKCWVFWDQFSNVLWKYQPDPRTIATSSNSMVCIKWIYDDRSPVHVQSKGLILPGWTNGSKVTWELQPIIWVCCCRCGRERGGRRRFIQSQLCKALLRILKLAPSYPCPPLLAI